MSSSTPITPLERRLFPREPGYVRIVCDVTMEASVVRRKKMVVAVAVAVAVAAEEERIFDKWRCVCVY